MTIRRGTKQAARFVPRILVLIVAAAALAALALTPVSGVSAQASQILGVDVRPSGNGSLSIGQMDGCLSVDAGEEFFVDIVVTNVEQLVAWELRVQYDASVLALEDADYNYFLLSAPGGSVFPSLFDAEKDNRYFLAAADVKGAADSGSGTLARLRFSAIGEGTSPVMIVDSPTIFGPLLVGSGGVAVGDSSGDKIWDGSVVDAEVEVGGACDENPIVTPAPSPEPTPQPSGGEPEPTTGSSGGTEPDPGNGSEPTSGPAVIADPDVNSGGAGQEPGSNEPDGDSGPQADGSGDEGRTPAGAGDEGGGGFPWVVVALLAALGTLVAGSGLLAYSRTRTG